VPFGGPRSFIAIEGTFADTGFHGGTIADCSSHGSFGERPMVEHDASDSVEIARFTCELIGARLASVGVFAPPLFVIPNGLDLDADGFCRWWTLNEGTIEVRQIDGPRLSARRMEDHELLKHCSDRRAAARAFSEAAAPYLAPTVGIRGEPHRWSLDVFLRWLLAFKVEPRLGRIVGEWATEDGKAAFLIRRNGGK
jgi:hypothetical protein